MLTKNEITDPNSQVLNWAISPPKWIAIVGMLFLSLGIAFAATRAYRSYSVSDGSFEFENAGMSDFHNGGYQTARAFRDGVNPYSTDGLVKYNMSRSAPTYSPVVFMLHMPFSYLEITKADIAFFATNTLLIALIGWFCVSMTGRPVHWSWWIWVSGLLIFSRPGHITLYTGYFTAMMVVGALIAIHYADKRPILSGLGMVLASLKPTYILPLIMLMVCRRNFKAATIGVLFCAITAGAGLGWLVSHSSVEAVIAGIKEGQDAFHADPTEIPMNTWTRLDTIGVVSKVMHWKPGNGFYLVAMILMLIIPCIAVFKISKIESDRGAAGLSGMIVAMAVLISIYHHSYDCLLITVTWFAVTFGGKHVCRELSNRERWALSALLGIPAVNYLSTMRFRDALGIENPSIVWDLITSINGVCLLIGLLVLLNAAWRLVRTHNSVDAVAQA